MGVKSLTFCIGGPFGHGQAVKDRADVSVRLSNMVLNHQVGQLSFEYVVTLITLKTSTGCLSLTDLGWCR